MTSIILGLFAAFAWGVHDMLVRFVSRDASIPAALFLVLTIGTLACLPLALLFGDWTRLSMSVAGLSLLAGGAFALASLSLYRAFAEGPVKLVAPIIGAYPIISVGWAEVAGTPIAAKDWLAVAIIVFGVGLVAALSDPDELSGRRRRAMLYAALSGIGFAATFALAQTAASAGGEWFVIVLMRLTAMLLILALVSRQDFASTRRHIGVLSGMGVLDAGALSLVTLAATLPHPEFAAVTTSVFGVVTILLARIFLKEPVSPAQWGSIALVFLGVALLGA